MELKRRQSAFSFFVSLFVITIALTHASHLCEKCNCFQYEQDYVISCKGYKNHVPEIDFELLEWPKSEEQTYKAFFNNISIRLLPKIAGDTKVISLNLDDNVIRNVESNPFEYLVNLESISLANNRITDLSKDFFKSSKNLMALNMANNSLTSLDGHILEHLEKLEELNLSHNFLTKLTADFLEATKSVLTMRLENNKIYAIDNAFDKVDYKLRKLFLAYNEFTVITSAMFEKIINLDVLDLSNNKISNIDETAFCTLTNLQLLDLSSNALKRIVMRLPDSIELLSMNNNNLIAWPLLNTPKNLTELELHQNNLEYIFPKDLEVPNLRILDVSNNLINFLPNTIFLQLEKLDLSYNLVDTVPKLNLIAPFLRDLILDGTQIERIEFDEKSILGSISLSYLPRLKKIETNAFANLTGSHVSRDKSENCIDLKISHNEFLTDIDQNAFEGLRICYLDMSYNNLTTIPENLTDWAKIDFGVDLQGNPLSCTCVDQWMLESILNTLYYNDALQVLLLELRCQSPEEFKGRRLVSFLNHKDPFCRSTSDVEKSSKIVQQSNFGGFFLDSDSATSPPSEKHLKFHLAPFSFGFIIIVTLSVIILVLIIIVGVKWQNDQHRKLARRNRLYYNDYDY